MTGREMLRPGFVRVSLPWFTTGPELEFVLAALKLVAASGWAALPLYTFNDETAEWKHRRHEQNLSRTRRWLGAAVFSAESVANGLAPPAKRPPAEDKLAGLAAEEYYTAVLAEAAETLRGAVEQPAQALAAVNGSAAAIADQELLLGEEHARLRWFLYPAEALTLLKKQAAQQGWPAAGPLATGAQPVAPAVGAVAAKGPFSVKVYEAVGEAAAVLAVDASAGHETVLQAEPAGHQPEPEKLAAAAAAAAAACGDGTACSGAGCSDAAAAVVVQAEHGGDAAKGATAGTRSEEFATAFLADMPPTPTSEATTAAAADGGEPAVASEHRWVFHPPGKKLLKKVFEAVSENAMLKDGDRSCPTPPLPPPPPPTTTTAAFVLLLLQ